MRNQRAKTAAETDRAAQILVIQPAAEGTLDRFEGWLKREGIRMRVLKPGRGDSIPQTFTDDALIVLGGWMSAYDDREHPWLADVRSLMRWAASAERPTLGICLGAQLMAQAFGGTVTRGPALEAGVVDVAWRDESDNDPLTAGLGSIRPLGAMHYDAITCLPDEAVWLASGRDYPHQMYRVGPCSWGIQAHPELSLESYRTWRAASRDTDPEAVEQLRRGDIEFADRQQEVYDVAEQLARRFGRVVLAAARSTPHDEASAHA